MNYFEILYYANKKEIVNNNNNNTGKETSTLDYISRSIARLCEKLKNCGCGKLSASDNCSCKACSFVYRIVTESRSHGKLEYDYENFTNEQIPVQSIIKHTKFSIFTVIFSDIWPSVCLVAPFCLTE